MTRVLTFISPDQRTLTSPIGKNPSFNAKERAFYYVRVIEIPAPRWTTYDAKVFGTKIPQGAPTSIQDRAYTSPIGIRRRSRNRCRRYRGVVTSLEDALKRRFA